MFTGGLTESTDPFPKRIPLFLVDGPSRLYERDPRLEDKRIPSEKRDPASRKLRRIPLSLSLIGIPFQRPGSSIDRDPLIRKMGRKECYEIVCATKLQFFCRFWF